ncbi:hypothetical protein ACN47E_008675 [Coniothyrium glycines]
MLFSTVSFWAASLLAVAADGRFVMYADEWHPTRPANPEDRAGIDHVILAFAMANATASFQPKVPISTIRSEYPSAKVMIAVGGWGDDIGFFQISQSDATIQQFANDVDSMLTNTGADGVDIDWEYPGGNGADYKQVPNSQKAYQVEAYPKVLAALRTAIGDKLLSIAVPGKSGDMIGFTKETGPKIWPSVDYINIMSYDLMNRRDNVTNHHTSVAGSEDTIKNYLAIGAPPEKMNLGFAYYAKYFATQGDCGSQPLGCPIVLAEDPVTGKDTLTSGAWTFEKAHMAPVDTSSLKTSYDGTCGPDKGTKCASGCCSQYGNCGTSPEHCSGACQHAFGVGCTDADVAGSWQLAAKAGVTDEEAGGQYYFDPQNRLFWTWDTPELISRKFDEIVRKYKLGGVMAWSLGEDSYDWSHIRQMAAELKKLSVTSDKPGRPHSQPLIPASPPVSPAPEQGPSDSAAPGQDDAADAPSVSSPTDDKPPYDTVYVDGTQQGPEGDYDYSSSPGSPSDYSMDYTYDDTSSSPSPYIPTEQTQSDQPSVPPSPSSFTWPGSFDDYASPPIWDDPSTYSEPAPPYNPDPPSSPDYDIPPPYPPYNDDDALYGLPPPPPPPLSPDTQPADLDTPSPAPFPDSAPSPYSDPDIPYTTPDVSSAPPDPASDFIPDPGYVNPNWNPEVADRVAVPVQAPAPLAILPETPPVTQDVAGGSGGTNDKQNAYVQSQSEGQYGQGGLRGYGKEYDNGGADGYGRSCRVKRRRKVRRG